MECAQKGARRTGRIFDARGIEEVLLPLHKQFAYMGMKPFLPTFAVRDVYKNPTVEADLLRWQATLKEAVKKLA